MCLSVTSCPPPYALSSPYASGSLNEYPLVSAYPESFAVLIIYCLWPSTAHWRIQEFTLGGQTKIPNRKLRAKPESRARSARVSRAKPESRARSARELRAKSEKKRGEGYGEGARWAPPQKICEKSNLKPFILVHIWSNYLKWLTKWFNCPHAWKIISNYLMWQNY